MTEGVEMRTIREGDLDVVTRNAASHVGSAPVEAQAQPRRERGPEDER